MGFMYSVVGLATQKINRYRRIGIKPCLSSQSGLKQLSSRVLSIQFRGSTLGSRPQRAGLAARVDVKTQPRRCSQIEIDVSVFNCMLTLFSIFPWSVWKYNWDHTDAHTHMCLLAWRCVLRHASIHNGYVSAALALLVQWAQISWKKKQRTQRTWEASLMWSLHTLQLTSVSVSLHCIVGG